MDSIYILTSKNEEDKMLEMLYNKRNEHWRLQSTESHWHTARMFQSLSRRFIKKDIYVDSIEHIKLIIAVFIKRKGRISINCEVWIKDNLSIVEVNKIVEILLCLITEFTKEDKVCFIRSLPNYLMERITEEYSKCNFKIAFTNYVYGLHFPFKKQEILVNYKDNFSIKYISENDVMAVLKSWKYGHPNDKEWMTSSLKQECSLGIYDNKKDILVGQFMFMLTGVFGALFVNDAYRGQGLGKLLIQEMITKCETLKMDMLVETEEDNLISIQLFTSINFCIRTKCVYVAFQTGEKIIEPQLDL